MSHHPDTDITRHSETDAPNPEIPAIEVTETVDANDKNDESGEDGSGKKPKKHLIKKTWLRRTLKCLGILLIVILLLPVLAYVPPVQTLLKNVACKMLSESTGMKISIDRFRLRFPVDVSLDGLCVIEASGDTMVRARTAEVDVKLMPLLKLDVQVKKLRLEEGYYRMLSADSSMTLKVYAPFFEASPGTSANIAQSLINLDEVTLRGGRLDLFMDVWKSKPTPPTPGVFVIKARKLHLQDFTFSMSMLPTIDSLGLTAKKLELEGGLVDLRKNIIEIQKAHLASGSATYITPTTEYVRTHPAPPPSPYPSKPMIIRAANIGLSDFAGLYATKGARPQPGFDPAYMQFTGLTLEIEDFFNEQTVVRLPITKLEGKERSGLTITSGEGTVAIDSAAIALRQLKVTTTASNLQADAHISMGSMALEPKAPFSLKGKMLIGLSDVEAFMPTMGKMLRPLRRYGHLQADIDASGTLSAIAVPKLDLRMPGFLILQAKGRVANAMDFKRLDANLDFYGSLMAPSPLQVLLQFKFFDLPPFTIKGNATARNQEYGANFNLTSPIGDVVAEGRVGLNSESYYADIDMRDLDVSKFAPEAGVGRLTGHLTAKGDGFNPTVRGADTDIDLKIDRVEYNRYPLTSILAKATLHHGAYDLDLTSDNAALTGNVVASGTLQPTLYSVDMTADISKLDMHLLGLSPDTTEARGVFTLQGTLNPDRLLCDLKLAGNDLYYRSGSTVYDIPGAIEAALLSQTDTVHAQVDARGLYFDFGAPQSMKSLMPQMEKAMTVLVRQVVKDKKLDMEALQAVLPDFDMQLRADGNGIVSDLLRPSNLTVDSISANINNHEKLLADAYALRFSTATMTLDTLTANLSERGQLLDYVLHMGNGAGPMEEYADVNLRGYVGQQRLAAFLRQKNIKGETGYRLGLTTYFTDTLMTVHFTPLRAIIGYLPWTFNDDNYISYNMKDHIQANLSALSKESKISVKTIPRPGKLLPMLAVQLYNIRLQDFMSMVPGAPEISGILNTDINLVYEDKAFTGEGTLDLKGFEYEGRKVADFNGKFNAGLDLNGNTTAHASLDIDGHRAMDFSGTLAKTEGGSLEPTNMKLDMEDFPLSLANAFLPADMAQVTGRLKGSMSMTGSLASPVLNGTIRCHGVKVLIPMMAGTLTLDSVPLTVENSKVTFEDFDIFGAKNSLTLNGTVDATKLSDTKLDLSLTGNNFMLINNDKRARSQIYGKILLNANATVQGPVNFLDVKGDLSVLNGTDCSYTLSEVQQMQQSQNSDVVKFVQFNDSLLVAQADSLARSAMMRISAGLNVSNGVQVTINLNNNGTNCVQLSPYGNLSFFQNYMGDMRLNGQLNLGNGFARYAIPAIGEKRFDFMPDSYVLFNGDIMNPTLHIMAQDEMKSVANTGGNSSRVLNFLVTVSATGTLSRPNVLFDLSTDDDISIENELQSMSADQRSNEAMNMLLYGRYMGPGSGSSGGAGGFATNALYGFLESQLNNWAANNIRGVDLSFGIDQYSTTTNGREGTSTSYSYQVSKSLFNNKFKIVVGGNYSTDQNSDQDIAENLISNISFEYMLRQTNSTSMYVKLFRHTNYESILEGEITEMGVGFVMQRKLSNLKQLFSWLKRKRRQNKKQGMPDPPTPTVTKLQKEQNEAAPADTIKLNP